MEIFIKGAQLLLSLSILVVLHELGHFIPAKLFRTRVEKFFLFFDAGFALFKKKIGDTVYGIGWLPLGGYVKIAGMVDESLDTEQLKQPAQPWEFRSKPAWQRLIIMVGGVVVNLLLGFLIYMMILFVWGSNEVQRKDISLGYEVSRTLQKYGFAHGDIPIAINGKPIDDTFHTANRHLLLREVQSVTVERAGQAVTLQVPHNISEEMFHNGEMRSFTPLRSATIADILEGGSAQKAGLEAGDRIVSLGGKSITYAHSLTNLTPLHSYSIEVERKGQIVSKEITLSADGKWGVYFDYAEKIVPTHLSYGLIESIKEGFSYGYWTLHDYVAQFKFIFTSKGATQVGGFASMGKMFADEWNWAKFWESTAMISIILAFMNILPIPALDGGHIVFLIYEMITGRTPHQKVLEVAQMVGIFILLGLMVYANGNDLYRWLIGKF